MPGPYFPIRAELATGGGGANQNSLHLFSPVIYTSPRFRSRSPRSRSRGPKVAKSEEQGPGRPRLTLTSGGPPTQPTRSWGAPQPNNNRFVKCIMSSNNTQNCSIFPLSIHSQFLHEQIFFTHLGAPPIPGGPTHVRNVRNGKSGPGRWGSVLGSLQG